MCYKFLYATILLTCIILSKSKIPYGIRKRETWRIECELGVIVDSECPIDGGWSSWAAWSSCQGSCNDVGHRRRTRECNNPTTSKDGTPCLGPDTEIETCYITNCSLKDFEELVTGDIARNEALNQLKAVPALLEKCLQMECPFEAIEAALSYDNIWQLNPEGLWNALQCVKRNLGCPIRGEWGIWGSWSACGARCGRGLQWRLRRCDSPLPSADNLVCSGTPLQSTDCEGDQCAVEASNVEYIARATWSEWGKWSPCSEICGSGVRRRKRSCLESHIRFTFFAWGTNCRGQHDQLEVCKNFDCSLDGGWSGWGPWSPCSQTCGAGRRSRTRSCTRPIPSGDGKNCDGPRVETGSCYINPCEVYTHTIALFNSDSYLQYNLNEKKSMLFHFFIRFRPLTPSGILVRRGSIQSPYIRLSLQKWHICIDASGMAPSCGLSWICSSVAIEPAVWHSVLVAVSTESVSIRLDDALTSTKASFPCDPELENSAINVFVGERFNGEIQELILNFKPLRLISDKDNRKRSPDYVPSFSSNVVYEKSNIEEAYLILENENYMRLPCFEEKDDWRLELTIKPKGVSGIILLLSDETSGSWLYMALVNMRLKIKMRIGEFKAESSSSHEYPPNQWIDITLCKHGGTNAIEAIINSGEKLHLLFMENVTNKPRKTLNPMNQQSYRNNISDLISISLCNDEFFVGNVPENIKSRILEDFAPFSGTIASLNVNGVLLDLHECSLECYKDTQIQLSSRTASVSHSYHETGWGVSNSLNLTCLHTRLDQRRISAHWLLLDTSVIEVLSDKNIKITDDGRMLKLIATDTHLRGFYTCREHSFKHTYNVVTYGIIGQLKYDFNSPDLITIIAVFTTVSLVLGTLSWLVWEGINDLRNGYGFFRDAHFSPQEEAEAICKYIDQNTHLFTSMNDVKLAKAKARRIGKELASRVSFGAQEPQGLLQMRNKIPEDSNEYETSDLNLLPALQERKSSHGNTSHDVFRCELTNTSPTGNSSDFDQFISPKHNSSSFEMSPRDLCSRLLLTKHNHTPKGSIRLRKDLTRRDGDGYVNKAVNFRTKRSAYVKLSPAQKVLQKFYELPKT